MDIKRPLKYTVKNEGKSWSIAQIWNDSLIDGRDRKLEVRKHIWASELGGAYLDRYLKMNAVPFTNPPNKRSLRKFQAGNIWEWIVGYVLKRAGILLDTQEHVKHQYKGLLEVTGKLDLIAGGKPDWDKAVKGVKELGLPEMLENATMAIIKDLQAQYPDELKKIVVEVKSCSSFIYDLYEATGRASMHHEFQLFHYLKSKGFDEGHLLYICRDDCRMLEFGVLNPSLVEEGYKKDIQTMTEYIRNKQEPEPEQEILFNAETGRFRKNWRVEYSQYLKYIYGYNTPEAYRNRWDKKVAQFNRVLTRAIEGKDMTKLNLELIKEAQATLGERWDRMLKTSKDVRKKLKKGS